MGFMFLISSDSFSSPQKAIEETRNSSQFLLSFTEDVDWDVVESLLSENASEVEEYQLFKNLNSLRIKSSTSLITLFLRLNSFVGLRELTAGGTDQSVVVYARYILSVKEEVSLDEFSEKLLEMDVFVARSYENLRSMIVFAPIESVQLLEALAGVIGVVKSELDGSEPAMIDPVTNGESFFYNKVNGRCQNVRGESGYNNKTPSEVLRSGNGDCVDFSNRFLTEENRIDFREVSFKGARLRNVGFSAYSGPNPDHADLRGADFTGAFDNYGTRIGGLYDKFTKFSAPSCKKDVRHDNSSIVVCSAQSRVDPLQTFATKFLEAGCPDDASLRNVDDQSSPEQFLKKSLSTAQLRSQKDERISVETQVEKFVEGFRNSSSSYCENPEIATSAMSEFLADLALVEGLVFEAKDTGDDDSTENFLIVMKGGTYSSIYFGN